MPQRDSVPLSVYRNGLLTTDLQVINIQESANAERLDTAHLHYFNRTLESREFHTQIVGEEIEIVRTDTGEVYHWGRTNVVPAQLNGQGEMLYIVSRTEKFHMGGRVGGIWVWNPITPAVDLVDHELIFNPVIDGKVHGNLNDLFKSEVGTGHSLFLSPESVRTTASQALQGANVANWPLSLCIEYLLLTLNADETYVANPVLATIAAACDDTNDLVLNTHIPVNTYLCDALDLLLEPLGYRWRVKRTALGARTFEFFRRTAGTVVQVRHQALNSTLSLGEQNVEALAMNFDVSNLFNQITVYGGLYAYEVSVELARGWAAAADDLLEADYAKGGATFSAVKDAWRKWVFNEAGDYIGLRTEINGQYTSAFRIAMAAEYGPTIWSELVPRRRKFGATLTLDAEGNPIGKHGPGIELEYYNAAYDPEAEDPEPEWKPIGNWGVQVLDHECAIYFDGEFPPLEEKFEVSARSGIRLRATFTLISDRRIESTATRQADSPQVDVAPLIIDAPLKFRHQEVSPLSKYHGGSLPSLEAIDNTAIADFAVRVRETWDLMDVGGAIQLEGLDASDNGTVYEVGQRVSGVLGKSISFEAKADSSEYPQIVAIERNVINQTTTLHLQRLKRQISFGGDIVRGNSRLGNRGRRQQ